MSSYSYVAIATASTASATSLAVTKPTGTTSGDLVIYGICRSATSTVTYTEPTGFTQETTTEDDFVANQCYVKLFWRICDGSEAGTFSASWSGSATRAIAYCVTYRGLTAFPVTTDVDQIAGASTAPTLSTSSRSNPVGADTLLVHQGWFGRCSGSSDGTGLFTAGGGLTDRLGGTVNSGTNLYLYGVTDFGWASANAFPGLSSVLDARASGVSQSPNNDLVVQLTPTATQGIDPATGGDAWAWTG